MELDIQNYLRREEDRKIKAQERENASEINLVYRNAEGETLSGSSLLDELMNQLEQEKENEEKLSIKLGVLKQTVERLKC